MNHMENELLLEVVKGFMAEYSPLAMEIEERYQVAEMEKYHGREKCCDECKYSIQETHHNPDGSTIKFTIRCEEAISRAYKIKPAFDLCERFRWKIKNCGNCGLYIEGFRRKHRDKTLVANICGTTAATVKPDAKKPDDYCPKWEECSQYGREIQIDGDIQPGQVFHLSPEELSSAWTVSEPAQYIGRIEEEETPENIPVIPAPGTFQVENNQLTQGKLISMNSTVTYPKPGEILAVHPDTPEACRSCRRWNRMSKEFQMCMGWPDRSDRNENDATFECEGYLSLTND